MMKKRSQQSAIQKNISRLVTVVCLAVFIYAAHGLAEIGLDYYNNQKDLANVQDVYERESSKTAASAQSQDIDLEDQSTKETEDQQQVRSQFEELLEQNEETVGWITIEDTNVDYPILQSGNNTDYLDKNFSGEEAIAGSLFLDYRNEISNASERNFIVYGHRVKDGSMFEHLKKFLDEDFFKSHKTFTVDTLYEEYEAEIFSVYNTLVDFNYIKTDFSSPEEYEQLLSKIQEMSMYETDVDLDADDQIITLSTCEYTLDPDDSRLVIQAKLTRK